jgi:hypothetical protein
MTSETRCAYHRSMNARRGFWPIQRMAPRASQEQPTHSAASFQALARRHAAMRPSSASTVSTTPYIGIASPMRPSLLAAALARPVSP